MTDYGLRSVRREEVENRDCGPLVPEVPVIPSFLLSTSKSPQPKSPGLNTDRT